MKKDQTVSEYLFTLGSESLLTELSESGEYWGRVADFVNRNYDKPVKELTPGHFAWLSKIRDGLIEEASK